MLGKYWEHFQHNGDKGIRGLGATEEEAFGQAATALTALITDLHSIAPIEQINIDCEAPNSELLLTEWLNALIHQMAERRMLFSRFEVQIDGPRLSGNAWGERVDVGRHKSAVEVKGSTLTRLKVACDETGTWLAQCVVDM